MHKKSVILGVILVVSVIYLKFFSKKPRDKEIDKAIQGIFEIKKRHHDLIVKALEDGISEVEHIALLEDKHDEVLAKMEEVEVKYNIEIDKSAPTEVGPVVVLRR